MRAFRSVGRPPLVLERGEGPYVWDADAMLEQGVFLPPSQFEAWFPSMTYGPSLIDATIAAARIAFKASVV